MDHLDSALDHRAARRRRAMLRSILFLPVGLALVLLAVALAAVALPPMPAEAATQLARLCPPESSVARPRAQATGEDLNGGELVPGDEILWTITVKNVGSTLTEIIVTDVVPEWTSYVGSSIEGSGADDSGYPTLTWVVGTLKCGDKVTISFRSRVDDGVPGGTLITNQASADSAQTPPGVSKAVTLEVGGSAVESSAGLSAASSPTTTTVLEETPGEDASAQTPGTSEVVAEAVAGSSQTSSPPSSSATALEGTAGDSPSPVAATAGEDRTGYKLGLGLGVGLGGLALIGGTAGLLVWRRGRAPGV